MNQIINVNEIDTKYDKVIEVRTVNLGGASGQVLVVRLA